MLGPQQSSPGGGAGSPRSMDGDFAQLACYVEQYLECVEALPLEIQRSVSLLREIDNRYRGYKPKRMPEDIVEVTEVQKADLDFNEKAPTSSTVSSQSINANRWKKSTREVLEVLNEIDDVYEQHANESDPEQKKHLQQQLQQALISSQEFGDEKLQIVTRMLELVENHVRQMDAHCKYFQEPQEIEKPTDKVKLETIQPERSSRRARRQRNSESRDLSHMGNGTDCEDQPPKEKKSKSTKKKKRSKAKVDRTASPVEFAIDPNEPTYCLCKQVSYGEMIGCDNEQCIIEWFHFSCVGLTYKPKGKWYCPKCRGDNEKTMDKCTEKTKKDRRSR